MNVVLDTNILVSAAWSPGRNAYDVLQACIAGRFTPCYDFRIIEEYDKVMHDPKLKFKEHEINAVLEPIIKSGFSVVAPALPHIPFVDESDRKFYEVAVAASAILITGNMKHYPDDDVAISREELDVELAKGM